VAKTSSPLENQIPTNRWTSASIGRERSHFLSRFCHHVTFTGEILHANPAGLEDPSKGMGQQDAPGWREKLHVEGQGPGLTDYERRLVVDKHTQST
jgi:hypothetical protein